MTKKAGIGRGGLNVKSGSTRELRMVGARKAVLERQRGKVAGASVVPILRKSELIGRGTWPRGGRGGG